MSEEANQIMMRERVVVHKMDHSGDEPVVVETIEQEKETPVSVADAMAMGWVPKDQQTTEPPVAGSATVSD